MKFSRTARALGGLLLVGMLGLSLLLAGCGGAALPLSHSPEPTPAPTPTPEPTPAPTMLVVNTDGLEAAPSDLYHEAVTAMRRCELEKAIALFERLGDYSDSQVNLEYCQRRLNAEPIPERERYLVDKNWLDNFPDGTLYGINLGYIYVPLTCDENTRACVYYAGGAGEDYLYRQGVYHYLKYFQPNAIMLFHFESCFMHSESWIARAAAVLEQVAQECGIMLHDVITVGSSAGCFTAMHAGAMLWRDYRIPVHAILSLDAAMEWIISTEKQLSDQECAILADRGTLLCLFEQEKARDYPEIQRLADLGCRTLVIACEHDDHNIISVNAYDYGLFSWGFEEIELASEEYTIYRIDA